MAGPSSTSSSGSLNPFNLDGRLGAAVVTTKEGSVYRFPDMSVGACQSVLPETGRIPSMADSLAMVNISVASMVIPYRVIAKVEMETEEGTTLLWACPA